MRFFHVSLIGFSIVLVLVSIKPHSSEAQSQRFLCKSTNTPPKTSLRIKNARIKVNTGRNRRQLLSMRGRSGSSATGAGWQPVGITETRPVFSSSINVKILKMVNGSFCIQPDRIKATIGFDMFNVFIAREYQRYSCEFNIIHEHEMTHVDIFKRTLREFTPKIETELREIAYRIRPINTRTAKMGVTLISQDIQRSMTPLIKKFLSALNLRNGRIDTAQSYLQILKRCKNW